MENSINRKSILFIILLVSISVLVACNSDKSDDYDESDDYDKEIVATDIREYQEVYFIDWLDKNNLLAIKENDTLDKLSLEELSDNYPTSIYSFNIETEIYELLLERDNVNLGEAAVSPNKNYMIYSEFTLGDPAYKIYNMKSGKDFSLSGEPIGGAMGAKWAQADEIIGVAYTGGIYMADVSGDIRLLDKVGDGMVYLVEKVGDQIFYNTNNNYTLMSYNLKSEERKILGFKGARDILPSPMNDQLLIIDSSEKGMTLYQYNLESDKQTKLAEGVTIEGISWSPSGSMIAYIMTSSDDTTSGSEVYIQDLTTDQTLQIAVGIQYGTTAWNITGEKLVYTSWDGENRNSSIVTLERQ